VSTKPTDITVRYTLDDDVELTITDRATENVIATIVLPAHTAAKLAKCIQEEIIKGKD
jgi:hypothetical protein